MIRKQSCIPILIIIILTLPSCLPTTRTGEVSKPPSSSPLATPPPATHSIKELVMPEDPTNQPPEPTVSQPADPPPATPPLQPAVQNWIDQARGALASRLGVNSSDIALITFEAKIWPDGGLGCPQPGMIYRQVPRDGYLIRLRFGKQDYNYHGGGARPPFLCEANIPEGDLLLPPPGLDE